jgi:hypothetical protein
VSRRADYLEGVSHNVASAERKAGLREYKQGAAGEAQAAATSATRKFRKRFKRNPFWGPPEVETHTFRAKGDRGKRWSSAEFGGEHLIIMQNYRTDWNHAIKNDYTSFLERYDHITLYDTSGRRVYPETDLDELKAFLNSLSKRQRKQFMKEVFYVNEERVV